jgi:hypothetical protein
MKAKLNLIFLILAAAILFLPAFHASAKNNYICALTYPPRCNYYPPQYNPPQNPPQATPPQTGTQNCQSCYAAPNGLTFCYTSPLCTPSTNSSPRTNTQPKSSQLQRY